MRQALVSRPGRHWAWEQVGHLSDRLEEAGCAGLIVTGIRFETAIGEAAEWCRVKNQGR